MFIVSEEDEVDRLRLENLALKKVISNLTGSPQPYKSSIVKQTPQPPNLPKLTKYEYLVKPHRGIF